MKTIVNALPVGTVLDSGKRKYRIVKVLGQGGFGITYQAVAKIKVGNIEVDVPFAIKEHFISSMNERQGVLVTTPAQSNAQEVKDSLSCFLVEAERLNRLSICHKGLVSVNESFRANDTAYYVMEYIGGQNLRQLVAASADHRLSETDALRLIGQVADAVGYLHQNQVTHLDIKPDNILLREDGTPVLIDFGLSKHYDRQGHATSSLKVAGCSDGYAPLEQYAGIDRFTPEADVYALAATLLFLLTGKDPRKASDITEQQILQSLPADVSETTRFAIVHGMQMVRGSRTQSVGKLQMELGVKTDSSIRKEQQSDSNSGTPTIKHADTPRVTTSVFQKVAPTRTSKPVPWKKIITVASIAVFLGIIFLPLKSKDGNSLVSLESTKQEQNEQYPTVTTDYETITAKGVSFNMVRVDGGTFTMGATSEQGSDAWDDEKPTHRVTLSSYYIGETEVTQALWEAVMGSNPSNWKGPNLPVESVSWDDCQEFIRRLNRETGKSFRLPTEAEWEYAARGGSKSRGYKYSGSNTIGDVAWYTDNSGSKTHSVKTKQANELGVYDMSGNVWEWCEDWYGSYSSSAQTDSKGPSSGADRVLRGGSWFNDAGDCRVSRRSLGTPSVRSNLLGLRLAL